MRYRIARLLAGLNLPPLLGAAIFFAYIELQQTTDIADLATNAPTAEPLLPLYAFIELIGFAYIFTGLQAGVSALLMEFLVFRLSDHPLAWLITGGLLGLFGSAIFQSAVVMFIGFLVGVMTTTVLIKIKQIELLKKNYLSN